MVQNWSVFLPGQAGQEEIGPEDHHQQRCAAHDLDQRAHRPAYASPGTDAGDTEDQAERKGEEQTEHGEDQRQRQAAQRSMRILANQEIQPVGVDQVDHAARTGKRP
jgi:hypothetical protein